ncbi:sensor histidine kinase [Chitinophagaceae bacterium MMS25-I14]
MNVKEIPVPFNILLVDDRIENIISLENILEGEGRTFLRAGSGNEALKTVLKTENIGLIMLDVQMPEMDGFEVARILKSNPKTRDISIIFVTAISKDEQYVLRGFEEGAVDYLQKPLDINVTRAKVNVFEQLYYYQYNLRENARQLAKINKQLEQFVYIVAHDLKSPLSGIITLLSVLENNTHILENNKTKEYVDVLSSAANHLAGMITSILDYSRQSMEQQAIEPVDVYELTSQIAHLLFPPKNIHIAISEDLPVINTRRFKLQQVFQNLISNAVKYNDKAEGLIDIGCDKDSNPDFYIFYIKDNGPGISSHDQDRIFKLFHTAGQKSAQDSSTGVGLNILKMLVEEQGGKIWVSSEEGSGSTFFFEWRK